MRPKGPLNDTQPSVAARPHPGRLYVVLGLLVALSGIAIDVFQLPAKILAAPWYVPILATAGLLMVLMALAQSRSIWRWLAAGFVTLLAAGEWQEDIAAPTTFLIDRQGTVRSFFRPPQVISRYSPPEILAAVDAELAAT